MMPSLQKLKSNKGVGPDNIPPKWIKDSAEVIAPYLSYIFNVSLSKGKFPDDWTSARICPMFKSGKRNKCANYRPIRILSAILKYSKNLYLNN